MNTTSIRCSTTHDTSAHALELDHTALDAARKRLPDDAVTPSYGPWRDSVVKLLNDALATELVCVLRYKRRHFTARGLAAPRVAEEFMVHANEEAAHADRLAGRIVQLGGEPDFSPQTLLSRSHAEYDESLDLKAMVRANLVAERVAVESYRQMVALVSRRQGPDDATTPRSATTAPPQPTPGGRALALFARTLSGWTAEPLNR